jgi:hypothetical protein
LAVVEVGGEGRVLAAYLIQEPGMQLGGVVWGWVQLPLGLKMQGKAEEFCGVGPSEVDGLGFLRFGRSGHGGNGVGRDEISLNSNTHRL